MEILKSNAQTAWQRDENGLLAVHFAVIGGHVNLINMFLDYYREETESRNVRDTALVDEKGFSLLHLACFNGHSACVETICELAENMACLVEMVATNGPLPPVYHPLSPVHCACLNGHTACIACLVGRFAAEAPHLVLDSVDSNGNSPLHLCAANNDAESAAVLLDAGCELNKTNRDGRTPLMLAALNNSFSVLELLLKRSISNVAQMNSTIDIPRRADLNMLDRDGNSVLHLALVNKHENCALFLLDEMKEDSDIINAQNKTGSENFSFY